MARRAVKVVLTREAGENASLASWVPDGCDVLEVPLTTTRYLGDDEVASELRASAFYGSFNALVVTSARAVRYVDVANAALAKGAEVFSVGPATTASLYERGVDVTAQAAGRAVDLTRQVLRGPVLVLGAAAMREELADALLARGLDVVKVTCYETVPVVPDEPAASALREAQVVFVGAPSAWAVARDFVSRDAWVVVPGATTAASVRAEHERVLEGWVPSLRERLASLATPS